MTTVDHGAESTNVIQESVRSGVRATKGGDRWLNLTVRTLGHSDQVRGLNPGGVGCQVSIGVDVAKLLGGGVE